MAIFSIPFTTIVLVQHSAGGVILAQGGQYLAGTYIGSQVASAFTAASSALASAASSVVVAASNPVVFGTVAIAVAAVGGYCYFYGIPAPVEAVLIKAGLATTAKSGLAISIGKLAIALVLLGSAGLLTFNIYKRLKHARKCAQTPSKEQAQKSAKAAFGSEVWAQYGEAIWLGASDTASQAAAWAEGIAGKAKESGEHLGSFAYSIKRYFDASIKRAINCVASAFNRSTRRRV